MNIHEITLAYVQGTLPDKIEALASIESKVDDYLAQACNTVEKLEPSGHRLAFACYMHQIALLKELSEAIANKVSAAVEIGPERTQFQL
jgi:hypothetical protein